MFIGQHVLCFRCFGKSLVSHILSINITNLSGELDEEMGINLQ